MIMIPSLVLLAIGQYIPRKCTVKYSPRLEVILNELTFNIPFSGMIFFIRFRMRGGVYGQIYPEGTPESKGVCLIIYPELSPNMDSLSFKQSICS